MYTYTGNNPVNMVDPTGHRAVSLSMTDGRNNSHKPGRRRPPSVIPPKPTPTQSSGSSGSSGSGKEDDIEYNEALCTLENLYNKVEELENDYRILEGELEIIEEQGRVIDNMHSSRNLGGIIIDLGNIGFAIPRTIYQGDPDGIVSGWYSFMSFGGDILYNWSERVGVELEITSKGSKILNEKFTIKLFEISIENYENKNGYSNER